MRIIFKIAGDKEDCKNGREVICLNITGVDFIKGWDDASLLGNVNHTSAKLFVMCEGEWIEIKCSCDKETEIGYDAIKKGIRNGEEEVTVNAVNVDYI